VSTNIVNEQGDALYLVCTAPTTPASGDPVLVGQLPGVALTKKQADGKTSVKLNGTATLSAKGETTVDAAIAVGDIVYYDTAATPHKINRDSTNGVRFGYALEAVGSGVTKTILVKIGY
jgi:predicted RecA/RadA family phage recombinase